MGGMGLHGWGMGEGGERKEEGSEKIWGVAEEGSWKERWRGSEVLEDSIKRRGEEREEGRRRGRGSEKKILRIETEMEKEKGIEKGIGMEIERERG